MGQRIFGFHMIMAHIRFDMYFLAYTPFFGEKPEGGTIFGEAGRGEGSERR